MQPETIRSLFPGTQQTIYLNTAALAIGATPVRAAYQSGLNTWMDGRFDYVEAEQAGEQVRELFARLIGARVQEIALVPFVSTAAGIIASQLRAAKPGDNIVVGEQEFSSNFYAWRLLQKQGYQIRLVDLSSGVHTDAYAELVDNSTRLLAVSAIQSSSGEAADLAALADLVHRNDGWLFVDACQAAGAVPLDVRALGIDFLATASHKFLCGTRGMGYLYVREELFSLMVPVLPGWRAAKVPLQSFYGPEMPLSETASKLDTSLAWFAALADRAALQIFDTFGAENLYERNRELVRHLRKRLREQGYEVPGTEAEVHSTIISLPVANAEAIQKQFAAANVIASARAGRIRLSLHFYNDYSDIDRAVELLGLPAEPPIQSTPRAKP